MPDTATSRRWLWPWWETTALGRDLWKMRGRNPHAGLTQSEQYLPAIIERMLHCPCYERQELKARLQTGYKRSTRAGYHPHVLPEWKDDSYEIVPVRMGDTVNCFVNAYPCSLHPEAWLSCETGAVPFPHPRT